MDSAIDPRKIARGGELSRLLAGRFLGSKSWFVQTDDEARQLRITSSRSREVLASAKGLDLALLPEESDSPSITESKIQHRLYQERIWKNSRTRMQASDLHLFITDLASGASNFQALRDVVEKLEASAENDNPQRWNRFFAYTDFASFPVHRCLLVLAATVGFAADVPARQTFEFKCRNIIEERGIPETVLDHLSTAGSVDECRESIIGRAHMVACLEEQKATEGYLDAAKEFEKLGDIRSAMAVVYRNTRYRIRDGQYSELDSDIGRFDPSTAKIDTLLAVLTATAPAKRMLPHRSRLYKQVRRTLKRRGEWEKGLLDGLK
jgi:hypothetical protein